MQIIYECLLPAQLHVFIVKSYATLRYCVCCQIPISLPLFYSR